jgi:YggT family protein
MSARAASGESNVIGQVLYTTIDIFFNIVLLLILVRILLSWVPQFRYNQIAELVYGITEPILSPFQRIVPPIGMIDISPMVAIIALAVIQNVLLWLIRNAFALSF